MKHKRSLFLAVMGALTLSFMLMSLLDTAESAEVTIQNMTNQRVVIHLSGGRMLDLLANGREDISDKDLTSTHLQALISSGVIKVLPKKDGKKEMSPKYFQKEKL